MKIFLATSFSHKIDVESGHVVPEFREFVTQVIESLRKGEGDVYNAMEYEGWKLSPLPPEVGIKKDLEELEAADAMLALVHDMPSAGVQFEMGYAAAKGKKVILARLTNEALAHYNQGIVSHGLVTLISYDNLDMLLQQLPSALNAPEE